MRTKLWLLLFSLLGVCVQAQTTLQEIADTPEKSGGVYYAYPLDFAPQTPAPKGYRPIYISHYGRHGSRYLLGDNDYRWVMDLLQQAADAHVLTDLGLDALQRLQLVWQEVEFHGDELAPLGERQHRGIAERMFRSFPEVFAADARIFARSTTSLRCRASMDAFVDRLRELNPRLAITHQTRRADMSYLNYHTPENIAFNSGPWKELYRKFEADHTHPERMMQSLFTDTEWVRWNVNPYELMWGFYWIASDMQDIETPVSFYDLFTAEELFDLWQSFNFRFYAGDCTWAGNNGLPIQSCRHLLQNILECADRSLAALRSKEAGDEAPVAVDLRFGHDGNIIPLAAILHLDGCYGVASDPDDFYRTWCDFQVAPMAANIQIIFYAPRHGDDLLVKFMLNENEKLLPIPSDLAPYYHWTDVRDFLGQQL